MAWMKSSMWATVFWRASVSVAPSLLELLHQRGQFVPALQGDAHMILL